MYRQPPLARSTGAATYRMDEDATASCALLTPSVGSTSNGRHAAYVLPRVVEDAHLCVQAARNVR